jgi:co-chaperonin GroES (HSP10)
MLADWVFLEPLEEEGDEEVTDAGIVVVSLEEKKELEARIVTPSQYMVEQGVKKGDVVGFLPDRDYKMKLDDDSIVYRMTDDDVLYVRN